MDTATYGVHRCRFVDWIPSAITALAFPPLPPPATKAVPSTSSRARSRFGPLAVGRANGNIEIYQWSGGSDKQKCPQAWVVTRVFAGARPSKIDSLAFTLRLPSTFPPSDVPQLEDLRFFSTSGSDQVFEWNIQSGTVLRTISSQGGSIWSMSPNPSSTHLALGCEDGVLRILSLHDNSFTHHRRLDRTKARLLSLAWGPPSLSPALSAEDSDDEETQPQWLDSWLVAGCSDSTIRKWDLQSGRIVSTMTTDKLRHERTLVWSVQVTRDGTIVSGDSLGMVKFWDPLTATQLQSFQAHGADVLCLVVGSAGDAVYSSGVDQKITEFSYVGVSEASAASPRWIQSTSRRLHSHDVRTLAIWPPSSLFPHSSHQKPPAVDSLTAPILASGGLDMSVVLTPCASPNISSKKQLQNPIVSSPSCSFEDSYYRKIGFAHPLSVGSGAIQAARSKRVILSRTDSGISLWKIDEPIEELRGLPHIAVDDDASWNKILEMELRISTNLISSAISDDGTWLAVSDTLETKLFHLSYENPARVTLHRVKQLSAVLQSQSPASAIQSSTGASVLAFTPDSSKCILAMFATSDIVILDLSQGKENVQVLRSFPQHSALDDSERLLKGLRGDTPTDIRNAKPSKQHPNKISCMCVSVDGQWLATSDLNGGTHIYNVDAIQYHCSLPSFSNAASAMSFDGSSPHRLILVFSNNTLQVFDVESRQFPEYCAAVCSAVSKRLEALHDSILGICCEPRDGGELSPPGSIVVWGSNWLGRLKFDQRPRGTNLAQNGARRRKLSSKAPTVFGAEDSDAQCVNVVTKFRQILGADFLATGELLVVERPLTDILPLLPPAYFRQKYGS